MTNPAAVAIAAGTKPNDMTMVRIKLMPLRMQARPPQRRTLFSLPIGAFTSVGIYREGIELTTKGLDVINNLPFYRCSIEELHNLGAN